MTAAGPGGPTEPAICPLRSMRTKRSIDNQDNPSHHSSSYPYVDVADVKSVNQGNCKLKGLVKSTRTP